MARRKEREQWNKSYYGWCKHQIQNERMQKHNVWHTETNTHLKLFQGGICSITQLFPQSGKVHWILNPVIVIWKLNRKQKLPSSKTDNSTLPMHPDNNFSLTYLFRISWFSINTINILPVKKKNNINKCIYNSFHRGSVTTKHTKQTSEVYPKSSPTLSCQATVSLRNVTYKHTANSPQT